jgi:hypothetical protein
MGDDVDFYSYFAQLATDAQAAAPPAAQQPPPPAQPTRRSECGGEDVPQPTGQPCSGELSVDAPEWTPPEWTPSELPSSEGTAQRADKTAGNATDATCDLQLQCNGRHATDKMYQATRDAQ